MVEPSGAFFKYRGWSAGKNRQAIKAELDKLKPDELEAAKKSALVKNF